MNQISKSGIRKYVSVELNPMRERIANRFSSCSSQVNKNINVYHYKYSKKMSLFILFY